MSHFPKKSVVAPIDFSDDSFAAIDVALECVDEPSHLHVVHVLPDITYDDLEKAWDEVDESKAQAKTKEKLAQRLTDEKYQGIDVQVVVGDPGHAITGFAAKVDADLIVMPSHGRHGLSRLLLGSVTERVLRLAECAVLVLKRPA